MTYVGAGIGLVPDEDVDLSERLIQNEEEDRKVLTDALTGLGNLRRLKLKTESLIEERAADPAPFSIGVFNIDRFKPLNDLFGRKAGDEILAQVALRISAALPDDATLVRISGDKFGMLLPTCFFEKDAEKVGLLLKEVFAAPFDLGERTVRMSACFGFCQHPFAGSSFDALFDRCESALYLAKKAGAGLVQVYTFEMEEEMRKRTRVEQALRKAIAAEEVIPYFQPIVSLNQGSVVGFECLARWTDPELGPVSPGVFIPLAEQAGFIDSLTKLLLRRAIECAQSWPKEIFLSFNLSSVQLIDPTTGLMILSMLNRMDFDPRRIEIEITETATMSDPVTAERVINDLRAAGIRLSLDDFGTGQSSLGRLRDFSFDKVKIDRAFVSALDEDKQSEHIVRAILNMCEALELSVIAEGIETPEQAEKLISLGCLAGQGFHYGRPADAENTLGYFRDAQAALSRVAL
ncbi:putative bifunctional diguanylate cyclase/phosphodiesterase [Oricola cellulosilytica]|uniref:EAL domain-containing protein n=1 Tax=Oricola cellulosilytica TaxID=1429082 RepID=A0A4R0PAV6_9HYPH|nr:EAL domain-containing protein [Oricola cellulosilytica]TCD14371.1 EAL domain-containing protein [Oricola cellulosilytica]